VVVARTALAEVLLAREPLAQAYGVVVPSPNHQCLVEVGVRAAAARVAPTFGNQSPSWSVTDARKIAILANARMNPMPPAQQRASTSHIFVFSLVRRIGKTRPEAGAARERSPRVAHR
jgi:hypothetical protein